MIEAVFGNKLTSAWCDHQKAGSASNFVLSVLNIQVKFAVLIDQYSFWLRFVSECTVLHFSKLCVEYENFFRTKHIALFEVLTKIVKYRPKLHTSECVPPFSYFYDVWN
jgi:hypothetical protein